MGGLRESKRAILEFLPLVIVLMALANQPSGDEIYKSITQAGALAICRVIVAKIEQKRSKE